MTLTWPIDSIGPVHTGIKPLWRIWRGHLIGEHEPHLVKVGPGVFFAGEITTFPSPISPGAC